MPKPKAISLPSEMQTIIENRYVAEERTCLEALRTRAINFDSGAWRA